MAKDPRIRGIRTHIAPDREPVDLEWACDEQRDIFRYGPSPVCASGGFGSAKTYALCLKALYLSDTYPCNRGVIARRVYEELKNTTMSTFFKLCPPEAYDKGRRADSEKYLKLNNGSEILWMHLEDPDAASILRGFEINWFLLDQAEEIEEEIFTILLTRLGRWDKAVVPQSVLDEWGGIDKWAWKNPLGKPIVPTYAMLACNPDIELHWIYQMFHPDSDQWKEKYRQQGYRMFFFDSRKNKFLPKQNLDAMLQQDESFVRRFVRGEWGIPEGNIHTIPPESLIPYNSELVESLRRNCNLFRTLDHGDSSPTCCIWWAVDRDGNVFGYREYYQPGLLISDHRKEISALSANERYTGNYADPQVSFKTMQKHGGMWSIADEYSDCVHYDKATALYWVDADNNELGTRNRINEYLRVDPKRVHPVTKQLGAPRLFFIQACEQYQQGCRHVVRETRAQKRVKVGSEQGKALFSDERNDRIADHSYDCLRYMIASRPPVAAGQRGIVYGKDSFEGWRQRLIKFRRNGDYDRMVRLAKLERARERQEERMARLNG